MGFSCLGRCGCWFLRSKRCVSRRLRQLWRTFTLGKFSGLPDSLKLEMFEREESKRTSNLKWGGLRKSVTEDSAPPVFSDITILALVSTVICRQRAAGKSNEGTAVAVEIRTCKGRFGGGVVFLLRESMAYIVSVCLVTPEVGSVNFFSLPPAVHSTQTPGSEPKH